MRLEHGMCTILLAIAALAVVAPTASAIEITDEATSEHCSEVTVAEGVPSGGCPMYFQSEERVLFLGNGFSAALCNFQFEMRLDEAGAGYIYDQTFTECAGTLMTPCPENQLWPVQLHEDVLGNHLMEAEMCIQVGGALVLCHLADFPLEQANHDNVEIHFDDGPTIFDARSCEGPVFWAFAHFTFTSDEAHPALEIN
jgi:hypothetical protein